MLNLDYFTNKRPKCTWCERTLSNAAFARGEAHLSTNNFGTCLDEEPPEWYEHTIDCEGLTLKEIRIRCQSKLPK